ADQDERRERRDLRDLLRREGDGSDRQADERSAARGLAVTVAITVGPLSMAIHVALSHYTDYRYDRPVSLSPHIVRLRPAPHCRTPVLSYSLKVEPRTQFLNWHQDSHVNHLARVV